MPETPTVYIVDDDRGALEIAALDDRAGRDSRQGVQFGQASFSTNTAQGDAPGCLVLDVRMPDMDGLTLQQAIRERKIRLPIIFISAYGDVPTCARAFRGGASDFMEKPVDDKLLLDHITRILSSAEQNRRNDRCASFGDRLSALTPTEAEILDSLIVGKSIKEIARARKVSVQTIWRHQMNIFHKVGVESHLELVRVATEWQLKKEGIAGRWNVSRAEGCHKLPIPCIATPDLGEWKYLHCASWNHVNQQSVAAEAIERIPNSASFPTADTRTSRQVSSQTTSAAKMSNARTVPSASNALLPDSRTRPRAVIVAIGNVKDAV